MNEGKPALLSAKIDQALAEADSLKYGDHQRVLALAQRASLDAEALGDFQRYAQALTYQAWAFGNLNRYEAALTASLEVLRIARTYNFTEVEARIVQTTRDFARAIGICQKAADRGFGLVSATYTRGYNRTDEPKPQQHGVLSKFGSVLKPREGSMRELAPRNSRSSKPLPMERSATAARSARRSMTRWRDLQAIASCCDRRPAQR